MLAPQTGLPYQPHGLREPNSAAIANGTSVLSTLVVGVCDVPHLALMSVLTG